LRLVLCNIKTLTLHLETQKFTYLSKCKQQVSNIIGIKTTFSCLNYLIWLQLLLIFNSCRAVYW